MDTEESTKDMIVNLKSCQENLVLEIIKELCDENKLSTKLKEKVFRIIADCDLSHYSSLHKLSAADQSTSILLGFTPQPAAELTFDEQTELTHGIVKKVQEKIPTLTNELETLEQTATKDKLSRKAQIKNLQNSFDDKLNTLQKQENEKVELMMEWLSHRLGEVTKFSDDSSELLTLKTRILELKSKILQLQIQQNIFTETNHSVKAYSEIYKDLKDSIKETEQSIQHFRDVIERDNK